jgi:transcription antitermination protein NusB
MNNAGVTGSRTRARELLVQALYQRQLAGHGCAELLEQFHDQAAYQRVDKDFFDTALTAICESQSSLEQTIGGLIDRPFEQLDPVELAVLLIGVYELESRVDVPYRVVINEGVNLARRFGAVDGHKYINACLDVAARTLRSVEIEAQGSG